jgi:hypothetical protein
MATATLALLAGLVVTAVARPDTTPAGDDIATPVAAPTTIAPTTTALSTTTAPPAARRAEPVGHPTTTSTTTAPPTTASPTSTTTAPPSTLLAETVAVPSPTTAPPATAPPTRPPATTPPPAPLPPASGLWTMAPYHGLGIWLDTWDWSPTFTNGAAAFRLSEIDVMAARGVDAIYIQTGRYDRPDAVLDPALLRQIIDRAHGQGIAVIGWYLPTMQDVNDDLRHLFAAAELPLDGLAVDIESLLVGDAATRTARLVEISERLDAAYPGAVLGAITLPPVATEILNPAYWPGHPWGALGQHYDVFLPMAYWGNRTPESGWWDGYRYTAENIDLVRSLTGRPDVPVHPIGGVGTDITGAQIDGMVRASAERGAIGGSIYDWYTTAADHWPALTGFSSW